MVMNGGGGRVGRWSAHGALLAGLVTVVALALAGCNSSTPPNQSSVSGTVGASPTATGTPTQLTPTAPPASDATWQQAALPPHFGPDANTPGLVVAPSDGDTAYACATTRSGSPLKTYVYASTDGGATFGGGTQVASGLSVCPQMVVDDLVPTRVVIDNNYGPSGTAGWQTTNGGTTWHAYNGPAIENMATINGTTYAIQLIKSANGNTTPLVKSTDGLSSWQSVSLPGGAQSESLDLWVQPNGSMLVMTGQNYYPTALFASADGGASWTKWPAAPSGFSSFDASDFTASMSSSGAWRLCTTRLVYQSNEYPIACTFDSGAHWSTLPLIGGDTHPVLSGITPDGTVVAASLPKARLYHLPPGASAWQSFGPSGLPPHSVSIQLFPTATGGRLWSFGGDVFIGGGGTAPSDAYYSTPYPAS